MSSASGATTPFQPDVSVMQEIYRFLISRKQLVTESETELSKFYVEDWKIITKHENEIGNYLGHILQGDALSGELEIMVEAASFWKHHVTRIKLTEDAKHSLLYRLADSVQFKKRPYSYSAREAKRPRLNNTKSLISLLSSVQVILEVLFLTGVWPDLGEHVADIIDHCISSRSSSSSNGSSSSRRVSISFKKSTALLEVVRAILSKYLCEPVPSSFDEEREEIALPAHIAKIAEATRTKYLYGTHAHLDRAFEQADISKLLAVLAIHYKGLSIISRSLLFSELTTQYSNVRVPDALLMNIIRTMQQETGFSNRQNDIAVRLIRNWLTKNSQGHWYHPNVVDVIDAFEDMALSMVANIQHYHLRQANFTFSYTGINYFIRLFLSCRSLSFFERYFYDRFFDVVQTQDEEVDRPLQGVEVVVAVKNAQDLKRKLRKLGATIASHISKTTKYLVFHRDLKQYLTDAAAYNVTVVNQNWVLECYAQRKIVDDRYYQGIQTSPFTHSVDKHDCYEDASTKYMLPVIAYLTILVESESDRFCAKLSKELDKFKERAVQLVQWAYEHYPSFALMTIPAANKSTTVAELLQPYIAKAMLNPNLCVLTDNILQSTNQSDRIPLSLEQTHEILDARLGTIHVVAPAELCYLLSLNDTEACMKTFRLFQLYVPVRSWKYYSVLLGTAIKYPEAPIRLLLGNILEDVNSHLNGTIASNESLPALFRECFQLCPRLMEEYVVSPMTITASSKDNVIIKLIQRSTAKLQELITAYYLEFLSTQTKLDVAEEIGSQAALMHAIEVAATSGTSRETAQIIRYIPSQLVTCIVEKWYTWFRSNEIQFKGNFPPNVHLECILRAPEFMNPRYKEYFTFVVHNLAVSSICPRTLQAIVMVTRYLTTHHVEVIKQYITKAQIYRPQQKSNSGVFCNLFKRSAPQRHAATNSTPPFLCHLLELLTSFESHADPNVLQEAALLVSTLKRMAGASAWDHILLTTFGLDPPQQYFDLVKICPLFTGNTIPHFLDVAVIT